MKIAISSAGKSENDNVSEISGRAPHYLIFEDGKLVKVLDNPFRIGGGGAGFAVAAMLADEKVEMVISGKFGPNMVTSLTEKGIKYKEVQGISVKQAAEEANK